jgi:hypothetical protein
MREGVIPSDDGIGKEGRTSCESRLRDGGARLSGRLLLSGT